MPCYRPVLCSYNKDKGIMLYGLPLLSELDKKYAMLRLGTNDLSGFFNCAVPCGKCIGCLLDYQNQWIGRIMAHLFYQSVYEACPYATFVTLTYDNEHLPLTEDGLPTLRYEDFQLFMKSLRRHYCERYGIDTSKVKYYVVGEYGSLRERPHYHAIIFGLDFYEYFRLLQQSNNKFIKAQISHIQQYFPQDTIMPFPSKDYLQMHGTPSLRSPTLERLWKRGICTIGSVNAHSVGYCARYSQKEKMIVFKSKQEKDEYFAGRKPYFSKCSKGIGEKYMLNFYTSIFARGKLQLPNCDREYNIPRYYVKKLKTIDESLYNEYKQKCWDFVNSEQFLKNNTVDRLAVREELCKNRCKKLIRVLDTNLSDFSDEKLAVA